MIIDAIKKEFIKAKERQWDKLYVFVDFHEVIMKPDYQSEDPVVAYYPFAKELLQHLSDREDICLIAWTCSNPSQTNGYLQVMSNDGIEFEYVNKNPEVKSKQAFGYYEDKPYYNILIDDKAGVMPEELEMILKEFKNHKL